MGVGDGGNTADRGAQVVHICVSRCARIVARLYFFLQAAESVVCIIRHIAIEVGHQYRSAKSIMMLGGYFQVGFSATQYDRFADGEFVQVRIILDSTFVPVTVGEVIRTERRVGIKHDHRIAKLVRLLALGVDYTGGIARITAQERALGQLGHIAAGDERFAAVQVAGGANFPKGESLERITIVVVAQVRDERTVGVVFALEGATDPVHDPSGLVASIFISGVEIVGGIVQIAEIPIEYLVSERIDIGARLEMLVFCRIRQAFDDRSLDAGGHGLTHQAIVGVGRLVAGAE